MNKYIIYCTEDQTKKAIKLGAPIKTLVYKEDYDGVKHYISIKKEYTVYQYAIPTAEQMVNWLEEQKEISDLHIFKPAICWTFELYLYNGDGKNNHPLFNSRKEATFAAIDAALDYLEKQKELD